MRVTFILSWLLLALTVHGATPEVGKAALRKLVKLPTITFQANWSFDPERGFTLGSVEQDAATQITALRKELKHTPNDAESFQRLGELYSAINDAPNAQKAWHRSVDLYRQRVDLQPDDAILLAGFGQALHGAGKSQEAESVLRKAVQLAPTEWKCLLALGRVLDAEARHDIYGDSETITDPATHFAQPASGNVSLAQRRLCEADAYFDQAIAAAPDEAAVYFRRGLHCCLRDLLLGQIRVAEGESKAEVYRANNYFSPAALGDLQHASRLSPQNYALIGNTLLFEIYTVTAPQGEINWPEFSRNSLPDKSQRSVHEAVTRLENLAQNPDPRLASGALEVLGIVQGPILHEPRSCLTHLRRALALDASREQAWEVLLATLAQAGRYDEMLAACQERLKQNDSARTRLLLAKALEKFKQWDAAENEILAALKQAPNSFTANLARAALLLKRSHDPALLGEANGWLARAEHLLGEIPAPQRTQQQIFDFTLTRGIYFALTDEVVTARQWVQTVISQDKNNKLAHDILSAMDY